MPESYNLHHDAVGNISRSVLITRMEIFPNGGVETFPKVSEIFPEPFLISRLGNISNSDDRTYNIHV